MRYHLVVFLVPDVKSDEQVVQIDEEFNSDLPADIALKEYIRAQETEAVPDVYPHNPNNFTCPGEGIKCLCWDIERGMI
jgi:hypothetical protein